jgi:3-oxoacyl-[acyl-carrier protein] reductase
VKPTSKPWRWHVQATDTQLERARLLDFDSIQPGDTAVIRHTLTAEDVAAFAGLSGDYNPLHMEDEFAGKTHLRKRVVHGMLVASYVSTLIGMQLPGAGALWMQQSFRWRNPVFVGDTIEVTLKVAHKSHGSRILSIEINAMNQNGKPVMEGEGTVSVPELRSSNHEAPIRERVAFVSGGSRGIGASVARALAAAGASVLVNFKSGTTAAEELCHTIAASGGVAIPALADVNDPAAVLRAAGLAQEAFGRPVDILINCAGGAVPPRPFLDTNWDELQAALDVHVKGAYNCCKAVVPGMAAQKSGRIVNIGSILTWNVPPSQWTAFVMAKAALKAFTRSLAAELGPLGIRVNMISPGTTETESIAAMPERIRKLQAMQTPLRRLATPEDIAQTALFLCGEGSQFITGADIPVCGGSGM